MPPGLFITATDTDVGKTYVGAMIARSLFEAGYRVGVYKPAASGCRSSVGDLISDDAVQLWEAAGRPADLQRVCPQRFAAPLAPHLAARAEGRRVDAKLLRDGIDYWRERSDVVLVEGAGGLLSPIADEVYVADLARDLGYPLVVVVRNALGTINHTLLTLEAAAARGLAVAGVVINATGTHDPSMESNPAELAARCHSPILGHVDWQAHKFDREIDWFGLASRDVVATR